MFVPDKLTALAADHGLKAAVGLAQIVEQAGGQGVDLKDGQMFWLQAKKVKPLPGQSRRRSACAEQSSENLQHSLGMPFQRRGKGRIFWISAALGQQMRECGSHVIPSTAEKSRSPFFPARQVPVPAR
jgi:hypothetical protein